MKAALLIYETPEDFAARHDGRAEAYWAGWGAYSQVLGRVSYGGAALRGPETATIVRVRDGARQVQDGPYADTKEQIGGFYLVDVDDMAIAVAHAQHCPAARSAGVEVRGVTDYGQAEG